MDVVPIGHDRNGTRMNGIGVRRGAVDEGKALDCRVNRWLILLEGQTMLNSGSKEQWASQQGDSNR